MTLIERAAEALYMRVQRLTYSADGTTFGLIPWARIEKKDREEFYQAARAVIKAIREPSEAMLDHSAPVTLDLNVSRMAWGAMIDALLEEGR